MPGQTCWIPDTNGVTDKTSFIVPDGVQVIPGWHENHGGIWLKADESLAGRTVTVNLYKNEIPAGTEGYWCMELRIRSGSQWECGLVQYHQLMEVFGLSANGMLFECKV